MLKSLLLSGPGLAALGSLVLSSVYWLGKKAFLKLSANAKTAPLAPLALDADAALADAVKAALADLRAGGKPVLTIVRDSADVALADLKADLPDVEKALEGEVNVLVNGAPSLTQTTVSGATVNLPDLSKK